MRTRMKCKKIIYMLLCLFLFAGVFPQTAKANEGTRIDTITITGVTEPVAGASASSAGVTVPEGAKYSIDTDACGWLWDPDDVGVYSDWFYDEFTAGVTYRFIAHINIQDGYYIDTLTTATINGKKASVQIYDGGQSVSLYFTVPGKNCTISYEANGGSGEMANASILENNSFVLPECGFTAPEGKEFKAWKIGDTEYLPGKKVKVKDDLTATAVWDNIQSFQVEFDMCGHGNAIIPQNVVRNAFAVEPAEPKESGYQFVAWYRDAEYTKEFNFSTDRVTANTRLYAKWLTYIPSIVISNLPDPVAGEKPNLEGVLVPTDANYAINMSYSGWLWDAEEDGVCSEWVFGKFCQGRKYLSRLELIIDPGYYIDENTKATINGKDAVIRNNGVELEYKLPGTVCKHEKKTLHKEVASTCSSFGNDAYKVCDDCGLLFDMNDHYLLMEPVRDLDLSKHGKLSVWRLEFEATEASTGRLYKRCEQCGIALEFYTLPIIPSGGGWAKDDYGVWFYYRNGARIVSNWLQLGNKRYYFNELGFMMTGWQNIDSNWYYFGTDGAMVTGWKEINGKWYYFDDGVMVTGWYRISGKWYRFNTSGAMVTGWQKITNKWYYFNASGAMVTGWQKISGKWYYFNISGIMVTDWQKIDGKWYYFNTSGVMATGWKKISNKWYYFNASGVMATGWQKISNKWYYFNTSGAMATGWLQIGGKWYYFDANGVMVTGTQTIGGKTYVFDANGVWVK